MTNTWSAFFQRTCVANCIYANTLLCFCFLLCLSALQ